MNIKRLFTITCSLLFGFTIILIWFLLGSPILTRAASHTVCTVGPPSCDYSSIQSAVDSAGDGDTIKVAAGTYTEINSKGGHAQVVYLDKSVTIRGGYTTTNWSAPDPVANPTTLDAQGNGRGLYITGNIAPIIEGLRITGGLTPGIGKGGGVYIFDATVNIRNNRIFGNTATNGGGGLALISSSGILSGNSFIDNIASNEGGGLALYSSDTKLIGNRFESNTCNGGGGGLFIGEGTPKLDGNIIYQNISNGPGGGLILDYSEAVLTNNIVSDNHGDSGLRISDSFPQLLHNTIARNGGSVGKGIHLKNESSFSTTILTNNTIADHAVGIYVELNSSASLNTTLWGSGVWANGTDWAGTGTINTTNNLWGNPDFVDSTAGDYHIGSNSDAIDQGVDAGVMTDIDFHPRPYQAPDIGADEYWPPGALKFIDLPIIIH